ATSTYLVNKVTSYLDFIFAIACFLLDLTKPHCSLFGSAERADYTAIGPSVNIAARLQAAALPGTILVSAAVADYLQEEEITKGSPLELKGVDETVLTFAVTPEVMVNR
ncbi:adenylate/guanylate cyclase domain-containing protein, partial [Nostoc sp. FACHB-133]|uniref:adenylate/guanylate cyclase domain-containing protein n=1 Tax=Nostoc sp. FACHB-133 TaxID=2692835 RepID=UPI001F54C2DC